MQASPYEQPWAKPGLKDCVFYHAMSLPAAGEVAGQWDIRPDFDNYTGRLDVRGKRLLDVGTCTGQIAFEMEARGAEVTAFDADSVARFQWVPFAGRLEHRDRAAWNARNEAGLTGYKNAFWFAWHERRSAVRVAYGDLARLSQTLPEQDIVLACAIIEHLSDPVTAIGQMARLARETLVIGFTPIDPAEEPLMRPMQPWHPDHPYVWWRLSLGLYRALLEQLGFEVTVIEAMALFHGEPAHRQTLVARRVRPA
jgi:SAM-dependent methyltransferase